MPAFAYRYPVDKLLTGASLGNPASFLKLTPQSDVAGLWNASDNQFYCGRWVTHMYVGGVRATPLETTHADAYQETSYTCGAVRIRKRTFLPMCEPLRVMYVVVTFDHNGAEADTAAVMCDVTYPAFVWPGTYKVPDQAQRNKRFSHREHDGLLISSTIGRPNEIRVFSGSAEVASTYVSDRGFSRTYSVPLQPKDQTSIWFTLSISHLGEAAALAAHA
ncbi:MAG: hypothetical protein JOZ28_05675, partial [Candidatus Eremiobacteraeota bacterium]|nr:hypothetical protein [Candidatus Eremiobacteraeota bacterium]